MIILRLVALLGIAALSWYVSRLYSGAVVSPVEAQVVYYSSPPYTLANGTTADATQVMANYNRIISDGNTAYTAFVAEIAAIGGVATPSGAVAPFNLSSCPTGWIPSNGSNGTNDLRGYFVAESVGDIAYGTVVQDQIIDHQHELSGNFLIGNGASSNFSNSNPQEYAPNSPYNSVGVNNADSGNYGSETRPKNVALLYCQKT